MSKHGNQQSQQRLNLPNVAEATPVRTREYRAQKYETVVFSGGEPDKLQVILNDRATIGLRYVDHIQRPGNELLLIFESL